MQKVWAHPIKLVIFDNDGTLMDTEWAYSWAHEQLCGQPIPPELTAQLLGKAHIESCQTMIKYFNLNETPEGLSKKREVLLDHCWRDIKLLPGVEKTVKKMKEMGLKMAIATSSRRHVFESKSQSHQDLIQLMDFTVCGNDVKNHKPHPDMFLAALQHFPGIKPEEAIVFEDSALGIHAANDAGMASVFVQPKDPQMALQVERI